MTYWQTHDVKLCQVLLATDEIRVHNWRGDKVVLDTTLRHEFVSTYRHVCSSTWHNFTSSSLSVRTDMYVVVLGTTLTHDVKLCQVLLHTCLYVLTNSMTYSCIKYYYIHACTYWQTHDVKLCQVLLHTCLYETDKLNVVVLDTTLRHEFVSTYRYVCGSTWHNFTSWVCQYVQACM
jgi:hypothetical protein